VTIAPRNSVGRERNSFSASMDEIPSIGRRSFAAEPRAARANERASERSGSFSSAAAAAAAAAVPVPPRDK